MPADGANRFGAVRGCRCGQHRRPLGVGEDLRGVRRLAAVHLDQIGAHLRGGLVAVVGVLGQRLEHHRVQVGGDVAVAGRRRHRILADMLVGDRDRGITDERRFAGEHLVEHAAQRVHVRAGVDLVAARLLRRQVLRGADHRGGLGDGVAGVGERAGDAEVHHLHRARLADHDVGGFDVAVDDAVLMAEVQRLAGVCDDLDGPLGRHRALGVHDVAQRHTLDVLHHDVGQRPGGRLGLPGVVHRDDGWVIQRGRVLRFAAEPQIEARVARQVGAQHLDRDVAVQPQVACQVDFGHAAEAEDLAEFVPIGEVLGGRHRNICSEASNIDVGGSTSSSGRDTRYPWNP